MSQLDLDAVNELFLFAVNSGDLYDDRLAVEKNLSKKLSRKIFDEKLAVKGFLPFVTKAAKAYGRELSTGERDGLAMFPTAERKAVAELFVDRFIAEAST